MQLRGMVWWIDRWRKSTAFIDLSLEQQGAYRNLLDEMWLRGGGIPNDPAAIARASGDAIRWPRIKAAVMRRFHLRDGAWHHDTLDALMHAATRYAAKQQAYRDRHRHGNGNGHAPGTPAVTTPVTEPVTTPVTEPVTSGGIRKQNTENRKQKYRIPDPKSLSTRTARAK